jgi:hypothetical protein
MITRQWKWMFAAGIVVGLAGRAQAQEGGDVEVSSAGYEAPADPDAPPGPYGPPPIPPDVDGSPVAGPGNSYCYDGPHPVDTRVSGGPAWDETQGPHTHFYAPFDLRLFRLNGSCYNFVGDPQDFGYVGTVYSYYGAHPIHDTYGGGWCFMVGGHHHWWQPWSQSFVIVNSWYYWNGPYDAVFWNYWPYYSYYYQSYYPHYYGGGRWWRHRDAHVAPRITHIPSHYARGWRANPGSGGNWRGGAPGGGGNWRGGAPGTVAPTPRHGAPATGNWQASGGGWRGGTSSATVTPPSRAPAPSPSSGGWGSRGTAPAPAANSGGWHGGGRASPPAPAANSGGWRGGASTAAPPPPPPRPAPSVHMPSTPMPSSGGGWKGGGGSSSHQGSARGGWRH